MVYNGAYKGVSIMYYGYHRRIKNRIANGELVGIEPSKDPQFAIVLVFSTAPHTRPIRQHALYRYEDVLGGEND